MAYQLVLTGSSFKIRMENDKLDDFFSLSLGLLPVFFIFQIFPKI
jgi:hypothetical protein